VGSAGFALSKQAENPHGVRGFSACVISTAAWGLRCAFPLPGICETCCISGMTHVRTSPFYPQSNGRPADIRRLNFTQLQCTQCQQAFESKPDNEDRKPEESESG